MGFLSEFDKVSAIELLRLSSKSELLDILEESKALDRLGIIIKDNTKIIHKV